MSIVPLAKVTVVGLAADKQRLLDGLQRLGCLHLIPLAPPPEEDAFGGASPSDRARQALRHLMDVPRRRHQSRVDAGFDFDRIVAEALSNRQRRREAEDRVLALERRLEELTPWGEFTLPPLEDLAGQRLWFYRVPHPRLAAFRKALEALGTPWHRLYESPRHAYVALISAEEPDPEALPVARSHVGSESARTVRLDLDAARTALEDIEAEQESLSRWIFLLSRHMARAEDAQARARAGGMTRDDEALVQLQGWIPRPLLPRLETFTRQEGLAFLAEVPDPRENPPTLLRNPESLSGGQDLVTFYETPGYRQWDPSIVVFFSFSLFFAMIMADAGYALVLVVVVALLWRRMGRTPGGCHFRILSLVGLAVAVFYGVIAGSYFGIEPPAGSWLGHLKRLDLNDFAGMMRLSLVVGCLHLILANGVVAFRGHGVAARAAPLGWIAVILGGLTLYLGGAVVTAAHAGTGLIVAGLLTILLLSSERPIASIGDLALRLLDGLGALTNLSKLFGDVMSYLRLFALGLASASLATTFNQLAEQVVRSVPTLGVLIALLILVLGHGINLLLAIISGFVHGLRLNFIEFFNWGLAEEGQPFRPFIKKELVS